MYQGITLFRQESVGLSGDIKVDGKWINGDEHYQSEC